MKKSSKVTQIDKKYKDKKTGEYKTLTINYSKVKDRLNDFREENAHGSIVTTHTILTDRITFRAHIIKDKSDSASAEATGHATGKDDGSEKVFEKLETIAVGRALALLGYASDGEIASSEEMEEFEDWKQTQFEERTESSKEKLEGSKDLKELKDTWAEFPIEIKNALNEVKEAMKVKLTPAAKPTPKPKPATKIQVEKTVGEEEYQESQTTEHEG